MMCDRDDTWKAATIELVQEIVEKDLEECTDEQREVFDRFRVPFRRASIVRYGAVEHVIIVAQRDTEVMYWEDVEEGSNFSPLGDDGRIAEHWCHQDELRFAINRWIP